MVLNYFLHAATNSLKLKNDEKFGAWGLSKMIMTSLFHGIFNMAVSQKWTDRIN